MLNCALSKRKIWPANICGAYGEPWMEETTEMHSILIQYQQVTRLALCLTFCAALTTLMA